MRRAYALFASFFHACPEQAESTSIDQLHAANSLFGWLVSRLVLFFFFQAVFFSHSILV